MLMNAAPGEQLRSYKSEMAQLGEQLQQNASHQHNKGNPYRG